MLHKLKRGDGINSHSWIQLQGCVASDTSPRRGLSRRWRGPPVPGPLPYCSCWPCAVLSLKVSPVAVMSMEGCAVLDRSGPADMCSAAAPPLKQGAGSSQSGLREG